MRITFAFAALVAAATGTRLFQEESLQKSQIDSDTDVDGPMSQKKQAMLSLAKQGWEFNEAAKGKSQKDKAMFRLASKEGKTFKNDLGLTQADNETEADSETDADVKEGTAGKSIL